MSKQSGSISSPTPEAARLNPRRRDSLYMRLAESALESDRHGRTINTTRKETIDNDVETLALALMTS